MSIIVIENVIVGHQCLSMETLIDAYGIGAGVRQRRHALKQGLMKKDGDCLVFSSTEYHVAQIVVSRECLETQSFSKVMEFDKENVVKRSATILRELVLKFIEDSPFLPLLPSIEILASDERQCPTQLKLFF